MPQPVSSDLHVDTLMTGISIAYKNADYIADQIFPIVPVAKQSDKYVIFDQSHWFRDEAKLRATATKSQRGGYTVTNASYFADRYSLAKEVADEQRDNADAPFNLDREATLFVTDKMQLRREVAFATDFFTTGVWGTDKVGGTDFTQWSNYAGSTPLADIESFVNTVEGSIGRTPNTWVMGKPVWSQLKWHPDLVDLIKYTQRGQLSTELFASLIEFERVLVGKAIYTTSVEGTAEGSVTYTRIWGKNALALWVPDRAGMTIPAAGYTFVWQRVPNALQYIKRMRDEEREVDIFEGNTYFDQRATGTTSGLFMSQAVA